MKKILNGLLFVVALLSFFGCVGPNQNSNVEDDKIKQRAKELYESYLVGQVWADYYAYSTYYDYITFEKDYIVFDNNVKKKITDFGLDNDENDYFWIYIYTDDTKYRVSYDIYSKDFFFSIYDNADERIDVQRLYFQETVADKQKAKELYESIVNTVWVDKNNEFFNFDYVTFGEDYIVLDDNIRKKITDFSLKKDDNNYYFKIYIYTDETLYDLKLSNSLLVLDFSFSNDYYNDFHKNNYPNDYHGTLYSKESLENDKPSDSGSESVKVQTGTYSFNNAVGMQYNGSITLNADNSWSFASEKPVNSIIDCTYSISGSELTLKWTANNIEFTEVFDVSVDGSSTEWSVKSTNGYNSSNSTIFNTLFGIMDSSVTFEYSE